MTDSRPLLEVEEHPPPQPPVAAVPSAGPAASGGTPTGAAAPEGAVTVAQAAEPSTPSPSPSPRLHLGHYLILVSLNSIGAFSSDCYIPNLSDIVDDLGATDQQVRANPNPHPHSNPNPNQQNAPHAASPSETLRDACVSFLLQVRTLTLTLAS